MLLLDRGQATMPSFRRGHKVQFVVLQHSIALVLSSFDLECVHIFFSETLDAFLFGEGTLYRMKDKKLR